MRRTNPGEVLGRGGEGPDAQEQSPSVGGGAGARYFSVRLRKAFRLPKMGEGANGNKLSGPLLSFLGTHNLGKERSKGKRS